MPQVYRDTANNFYVDGQPIDLDTFQQLGINADFVTPGSTVELSQAVTGQTQLPKVVQDALDRLYNAGYKINPNAQINERSIDEFMTIAGNEINPYYQTQLKQISDDLKRSLGYSTEQLLQTERDLETKYGRSLRTLAEDSAEKGFTRSGIREREEQELASDTQKTIEQARQRLGYTTSNTVSRFAQQYSGLPGFQMPSRTLPQAPQVSAGQPNFQRSGRELPFYDLSPEVYEGLIGEQEFQRRGAIRSRASELEEAQNQQNSIRQTSI